MTTGDPGQLTESAPDASSYYEQIVRSLTSGVITADAAGHILATNAAAHEHLGLPAGALQPGQWLGGHDALRPFLDILGEMAGSRQPMPRREFFMGEPDAKQIEIGVSVSPLEGPGRSNGAIFLFTDMTERRKLERAADLNKQLAQLGELAAGVVHELRNPLMIILGRSELLLRQFADDDKAYKGVKSILDEARLLERAIAQFLGFAKPFELQPSASLVGDIVDRAFQLCRHRAEGKAVHLESAECGPFSPMHVDAERLSEALANIIGNAIDAVDTGGHVSVGVEQAGLFTHFEILDDGPGIHLGAAQDLFSPFFTQKRDGTGLGLSIVQRIVTTQGGSVTYGNRPRGGARFEVRVPTIQGRTE